MTDSPAPRVLYAEDTPADRELMRLVCQQKGLQVDWEDVTTCAELEQRITDIATDPQRHIDLAILDLRLPDGLSTELLPAFDQHLPELPIVVFSTSSDPNDRARVADHPRASYLTKPSTLAEYDAILGRIRDVRVHS